MAGHLEPMAQPNQQNCVEQSQVNSDPNPQLHVNCKPVTCIRNGCSNPAVTNPEWEDEYCSNECVVTHCRNVFLSWVGSNMQEDSATTTV